MKPTNEVLFRDFDIRFQAHPVTGKLIIKKNNQAIQQALRNLIMTNLMERPYRPTFGSTVKSSLFENYLPFVQENLRSAIRLAIENNEPRVQLIDIRFGGDPDQHTLLVEIIYRSVNARAPESLVVELERLR